MGSLEVPASEGCGNLGARSPVEKKDVFFPDFLALSAFEFYGNPSLRKSRHEGKGRLEEHE
jgi:hypothetical protein